MTGYVARNHLGQRVGEHHQRARYSDAVVREARRLHGEGWGYTRIARQLGAHRMTVRDWVQFATRYSA